jgi:hypothetical protein
MNKVEDDGFEGIGCAIALYAIAIVLSAFILGSIFYLLRLFA